MIEYKTTEGDMLDQLCFKIYGFVPGAIEAVLDANPGLCFLGEVYAAGVKITFPDIEPPVIEESRVWD